MLVDVSHGSDRLVEDAAEICREKGFPLVASHSGANGVFDCARNLNDEGLRLIAESGGVVGLCFCADFISSDGSEEGQARALLNHAERIINAGGEDCLAIGSDFDGIPENPYIKNPSAVPRFLLRFEERFGTRRTEKFAYKNFLRVFSEQ